IPSTSWSFSWKCRTFKSKYFSWYNRKTASHVSSATRRWLVFPFRRSRRPSKPCSSIRSRHRRIVRGVTPMISAADSQLIRLAIAFSNTSCNFIIRSTSAAGIDWLDSIQTASPAALIKRTDHVLIRPDTSCASDTQRELECQQRQFDIHSVDAVGSGFAKSVESPDQGRQNHETCQNHRRGQGGTGLRSHMCQPLRL